MAQAITFAPVTRDRWPDLERLFGPNGAYGGCWCMFWRQTRKDYETLKGAENKTSMQTIVERDEVPGIIGYIDGVPAGWVSVGPRAAFPSLNRSRTLKPVDDEPAWSIVCFYVAREHRGTGMMSQLIGAAADHARDQGATLIEGYPEEVAADGQKNVSFAGAYMGLRPAFERAGFVEVVKRGRQPIMRKTLR